MPSVPVVAVATTAPVSSWNTTLTPGSGAPRRSTVKVRGSGPASTTDVSAPASVRGRPPSRVGAPVSSPNGLLSACGGVPDSYSRGVSDVLEKHASGAFARPRTPTADATIQAV